MKRFLLKTILFMGFGVGVTPSIALTDTYFATGEDLDYIIESDVTTPLLELEYKLRRYVLFRHLEDFFLNVISENFGDFDEDD